MFTVTNGGYGGKRVLSVTTNPSRSEQIAAGACAAANQASVAITQAGVAIAGGVSVVQSSLHEVVAPGNLVSRTISQFAEGAQGFATFLTKNLLEGTPAPEANALEDTLIEQPGTQDQKVILPRESVLAILNQPNAEKLGRFEEQGFVAHDSRTIIIALSDQLIAYQNAPKTEKSQKLDLFFSMIHLTKEIHKERLKTENVLDVAEEYINHCLRENAISGLSNTVKINDTEGTISIGKLICLLVPGEYAEITAASFQTDEELPPVEMPAAIEEAVETASNPSSDTTGESTELPEQTKIPKKQSKFSELAEQLQRIEGEIKVLKTELEKEENVGKKLKTSIQLGKASDAAKMLERQITEALRDSSKR
ncbi:MAG TPA: hypothetical protein VJK48_00070 [Chlamydiales bacterium]|nr:hypothetical protein [Chlamydiales bacterium]